jgi:hypothetical protein
MRCDTKPHKAYCGIDLHARRMSMGILSQDGEIVLHRTLQTRPEMLLKAIAPSRAALVVCVAGMCTWYGLADRCARDGMPCVLGHARARQASHGSTAHNDTSDAQHIAGLLRGGLLPPAVGSPAALRATRARLRRRTHVRRTRAALLTPLPQTKRPSPLPERGQ